MKICEVQWIDAAGPADESTFTLEEAAGVKILPMKDVGYLISEDERQIVIASQISEVGGCRRIIAIPKSGIVKKRVLAYV